MQQIVINQCFGGFGLSVKATELYLAKKGKTAHWFKCTFLPNNEDKFEPISWEQAEDELTVLCYTELPRTDNTAFFASEIPRDDPDLIATVRELPRSVNTRFSNLVIVDDVPDDVDWFIAEYDGLEHVAEKHRTWS